MVGTIEIICGPMYSGKTEELQRRIKRALIGKKNVVAFKPIIDDRYDAVSIVTHDGRAVDAIPVENNFDIYEYVSTRKETIDIVAIDEAQFFCVGLYKTVRALSTFVKRIIVAGLDTDFRGEPFGAMPNILAIAQKVTKLTAVCTVCGENNATMTQRIIDGEPADWNSPIVMVGAKECYEVRCTEHHEIRRGMNDSSS